MDKALVVVSMLMMAGGVHLPHAANVTKGKVLFERPHLGGGTMGQSCITCHDGGKRLGGDLFKPKTMDLMGRNKESLPDGINKCIEHYLGGAALDPEGKEMQDLIAYMKISTSRPAKK
jgi:mono/diheme cytochrome c family protein